MSWLEMDETKRVFLIRAGQTFRDTNEPNQGNDGQGFRTAERKTSADHPIIAPTLGVTGLKCRVQGIAVMVDRNNASMNAVIRDHEHKRKRDRLEMRSPVIRNLSHELIATAPLCIAHISSVVRHMGPPSNSVRPAAPFAVI